MNKTEELVKQAQDLLDSDELLDRTEARGMLRVINVLELLKANEPEPEIGLDGMYGDRINTVGELRNVMSELSDEDQIVLAPCDENGDETDHFPMYVDVYDNIRLTDGSVINEVRFCQMLHEPEPDTNDYRIGLNFNKVYDKLIKTVGRTDIAHGMGYSTTTQLANVQSGSSCISTPAVMALVKNFKVNPEFMFKGTGKMFTD